MENNEAIPRSVSMGMLTWRVTQKRGISLSRATKNGIALHLVLNVKPEDLTEYEELLINDSAVGRLKALLVEKIRETMGQQKLGGQNV